MRRLSLNVRPLRKNKLRTRKFSPKGALDCVSSSLSDPRLSLSDSPYSSSWSEAETDEASSESEVYDMAVRCRRSCVSQRVRGSSQRISTKLVITHRTSECPRLILQHTRRRWGGSRRLILTLKLVLRRVPLVPERQAFIHFIPECGGEVKSQCGNTRHRGAAAVNQ